MTTGTVVARTQEEDAVMDARSSVMVTRLRLIGWSAALAGVLACQPAVAASQRAPGSGPVKAAAQVDFRIVIPARIRVPASAAPDALLARDQHRSVERRADRTIITVAQP
jgi:hypothetical protein